MFSFLIGRIFHGVITLMIVVILISGIIYLAPVDPARLTFGQRSDTATIETKKKELGLDLPLYHQLFLYLKDLSPLAIVEQNKSDGQ